MPHNARVPLIKQVDVIAFDADDTLWKNEELFWEFKSEIKSILTHYIPVDEQVLSQLDEKEVANIPHYGYGFKSYTLSMIESVIELTEGKVDTTEIIAMLEIAKQKMDAETQLFIGVEETLMQLKGQVDMMLVTKGDSHEQRKKIERSGLWRYFRWIEIVPRKDEGIYKEILAKYSIPAERFMMIGNSLRSDVLPIAAIGGRGVYISNDTNWAHENQLKTEWEGLQYETLDSFLDLIPYLY
ncbi:MAG: HAD family hydrolase [Anaerolineae bacterium]|jgi:putative hydrolase of the HAD superfamily|nr:HAD family hydrolase [Anaerolineae bacterium]